MRKILPLTNRCLDGIINILSFFSSFCQTLNVIEKFVCHFHAKRAITNSGSINKGMRKNKTKTRGNIHNTEKYCGKFVASRTAVG